MEPSKVIDHIRNNKLSAQSQRQQLDLINAMNRDHRDARAGDDQLESRIQSFEMAFRMQTEATEAFDLSRETTTTRSLYGPGSYADSLIIARRLVQRGVRTVQVFTGAGQPWDDHGNIVNGHRSKAQASDRAIAALLADLKRLGLLDETLVLWGGEFGRTPTSEGADGRDHHIFGFSVWMAGGGIKGGVAHGRTDELGFHAVESRHYVTDIHATILRQMGLDSRKLEIPGRKRLEIDHGKPITEIIA